MENKNYSIGEFASMNKVSTRMLRHYDKIGLLRPVSVLQNGYRCYSEEQIEAISQIKRLRGCGFLLDEIDEILQRDSPQFLAEEAKRKLSTLQDQATQQQASIQALCQLIRENGSVIFPSIYGVSLSTQTAAKMLVLKQPVPLDEIEDAFESLFQLLHQKKLQVTGCTISLNHLDRQDGDQNQVGVPILKTYHDEQYQTLLLPSTPVLSVIHYGDYYKIGHAYSTLLSYAEQNACPISDTFMERYFIDSSHGCNPNEYVTEISVSIKNTP